MKNKIPHRLRTAVALRDEGICQICGKGGKLKPYFGCYWMAFERPKNWHSKGRGGVGYYGLSFEVDHIVPESKGGKTILDNLMLTCRSCNRRKGNALYPNSLDKT